MAGEHLDVRTDAQDPRGPDEDAVQAGERAGGVEGGGERVDLRAVRVALDVDVERVERALRRVGDPSRQQDGAGAGAEHRPSRAEERAQWRLETVAFDAMHHRSR